MMDVWCTFGAMAMKPAILDAVLAKNPKFEIVKMTVKEEPVGKPAVDFVRDSTGYLDEASTVEIRGLLSEHVNAAIPNAELTVSIFAAGRMCRLSNVHKQGMLDAMKDAHEAFKATMGYQKPNRRLIALLGATLIDQKLSQDVTNPGVAGSVKNAFFLEPHEMAAVANWIGHPKFASAQSTLLSAPTWDEGCDETYAYYNGSDRAAN